MKSRTLSRFLAAARVAGSAFVAAPAVYAADTPAAQAQEEQAPFQGDVVQQHMMATIDRFEKGDIAGLQNEATADLKAHLSADQLKEAKAQFAQDWGARVSVGKPYMTAGKENNAWFAVCEIAVGYKATAVVYRLSYDQNMKLAGFFIR